MDENLEVKMIRKFIFTVVLLLLIPFGVGAQEHIVPFYSFEGGNLGENPKGENMLSIGENIYGTTYYGGLHGAGTIYRIHKNLGTYEVLHHFTGDTGAVVNGKPRGRLLYDGESIFGACSYYSGNSGGIVYSIKPDGSGFTILADFHDATGAFSYGKYPGYGGLLLLNGVLYGSTSLGGNTNVQFSLGNGVLFSLNKDGSNFNAFYKFTSAGGEGINCYSGLVYRNGRLYGVTANDGDNNAGTIFSVNLDGTDFKVLRHLVGNIDGSDVLSPSLLVGDTLYITPRIGGVNNKGTIISIKTDGTDFKVLHSFNTIDGDGPGLYGGLVKVVDYLYGTTNDGGGSDEGVLYRIKFDGSAFEVLDDFDENKGSRYKGMSYDAPYLYGSSYEGGTGTLDEGTIWEYYVGYPPLPWVLFAPAISGSSAP